MGLRSTCINLRRAVQPTHTPHTSKPQPPNSPCSLATPQSDLSSGLSSPEPSAAYVRVVVDTAAARHLLADLEGGGGLASRGRPPTPHQKHFPQGENEMHNPQRQQYCAKANSGGPRLFTFAHPLWTPMVILKQKKWGCCPQTDCAITNTTGPPQQCYSFFFVEDHSATSYVERRWRLEAHFRHTNFFWRQPTKLPLCH